MTKCGISLEDLGTKRLSWRTLKSFILHLSFDSALVYEISPDKQEHIMWLRGNLDSFLLASVVDALNALRVQHARANSKHPKAIKDAEPIPRPGIRDKSNTETYGKDAIPIADFKTWWEQGGE